MYRHRPVGQHPRNPTYDYTKKPWIFPVDQSCHVVYQQKEYFMYFNIPSEGAYKNPASEFAVEFSAAGHVEVVIIVLNHHRNMQFQQKGYFSFKNRGPIPIKKRVKFGLILKQILSFLKPGAKVLGKLLYQPKGIKINRGRRYFVITLCVNWALWVIAEQMRASFPWRAQRATEFQ